MTIIDILNATLVGKQISMIKYECRMPATVNPTFRLFWKKEHIANWVHKDPQYTLVGNVAATITGVFGYSDKYEGDSIYLLIEESGTKEQIYITVEDEFEFVNN